MSGPESFLARGCPDMRMKRETTASTFHGDAAQRVLVVDDNRDAAQTLALLLELNGAESRAVYDGSSALALAQGWLPDAVLCDLSLPDLDGCAVARALRSNPSTAHTRLIALTGHSSADDRNQCIAAGFDDYFVKPAPLSLLMDAVSGPLRPLASAI